jgi:hypothetical protein
MRSGEQIDVAQFLKGLVQMAADDVRRREGFPVSSAEQEARCSVANEFFEKSGNRRVELQLAKAIHCLEPLFNPTVMNFLLDKDDKEVRGNVLVNLDAKPGSSKTPLVAMVLYAGSS